jgi:hypothetical protein
MFERSQNLIILQGTLLFTIFHENTFLSICLCFTKFLFKDYLERRFISIASLDSNGYSKHWTTTVWASINILFTILLQQRQHLFDGLGLNSYQHN